MNTNVFEHAELEARLETAFDAIGDSIGTPTRDAAQVWSAMERRTSRRRRTRVIAGFAAVTALATGGTAQYAAVSNNEVAKRINIRMADGREGLLIPGWRPNDNQLTLLPMNLSSSLGLSELHVIWGKGPTTIRLSSWITRIAPGTDTRMVDQTTSLVALGPSEEVSQTGERFARWVTGDLMVVLRTSRDVSKGDFDAVRALVTINAEGLAVVNKEPLGLPLLVQSSLPEYFDGWTVSAGASRTLISAMRRNPEYEKVPARMEPHGDRSVVVRGVTASIDQFADGSGSGAALVGLTWIEGDMWYSVSAKDRETAVRVANSLRPPTDDDWAELRRLPNTSEPYVYSADHVLELGTIDVAGGTVVGTSAELVTDGCVKITLNVGGAAEKICVKLTTDPVLWSGVRTINGKRVVIAIVGNAVDATRVVNNDTPVIAGTVNDSEVDVEWISEGTPIYLDNKGSKSTWIGLVAQATDEPAPVLEVLRNGNLDRTETEPLLDANDELITPLRPLARTSIVG
jgi:hypothetical protein